MRLKLPTSLAPIPFYKGFSALQVRLTPKIGESLENTYDQRDRSRDSLGTSDHGPVPLIVSSILSLLSASFRLINGSLSVRLLRTASPTASDSQSVTLELPVRHDGQKTRNVYTVLIICTL